MWWETAGKLETYKEANPTYDGPEPDGFWILTVKEPDAEYTLNFKYIKHFTVDLAALHVHFWERGYSFEVPTSRVVCCEVFPNSNEVVEALTTYNKEREAIWKEMQDGHDGSSSF